ncbi:LacI family DNA-binding transcriptional regulator [Arthrobacter glacialis]|uniref:LacI family transcriptional regulator n=1 Tax=Arthrobacter glacialis TaxID=1664 RepID=A0A2S3ZYF9_ARTGL|nr:LacI family DNA-binding transcriptional regulator [Arthrobacter glacialis]POH57359.1 LacI family transcriptional regulator [Arthrobacter glacialis]POH74325.1 LacI family transcriptional regulator [Arthrobacter glacialis]
MATMNDVARAAGVSTSTVSYVLSGKRTISADTRNQVLAAIEKLGYSPHAGARALASNRSNVLGLVVPLRDDVNVSVVMQFVAAVVTTARNFEQDVLLLTQDDIGGIERVTSQSVVDGLVMMDIEARDPRIPLLAKMRKPAVLIGVPDDAHGLSCVDFDFAAASRVSVRHLVELGHRRIALIGSPQASLERHATYADRVRSGFEEACRNAGAHFASRACEPTSSALVEALQELVTGPQAATGLVVHNEFLIPFLRDTLATMGLRVPEDLSIVAIAPTDVALASTVPWTAVSIPAHDIGRTAVEMVMERMHSEKPTEVRLIVPTLVERGTTVAVTSESKDGRVH